MFSILKKKKSTCLLIDLGFNYYGEYDDNFSFMGHFPYGLLSIATFLENSGIGTDFLELDQVFPTKILKPTENIIKTLENILKKYFKRNKINVIGVSILCSIQCPFAYQVFKLIKELDKTIITIVGGPHVTFLDERSLRECKEIDIVVRNEGEWVFRELVACINKNKDFDTIKGITFRKNDRIVKNPNRELGDLNELPAINFDLIPKEYYRNRIVNIAPTRGCIYKCNFCIDCVFWGYQRRTIPINKVFIESKLLFEKYKVSFINYEDSMVSDNDDYYIELSKTLIKIPSRKLGSLLGRVNCVNDDLLKALKNAGFHLIIYGYESGSEKVLKAMNKKITFEQVRKTSEITHKYGLAVGSFWIVGHPGDSPKEMAITKEYVNNLYKDKLIDTSRIYKFVPYPGTDYFANPEKYGIKILHYNWEKWGRCEKDGICELNNFKESEINKEYQELLSIALDYEYLPK